MQTKKDFYDVVIDSLTDKSETPIRIMMDRAGDDEAHLLNYAFEKRGNAFAMSAATSCGMTMMDKDLFDGSDRVYKHVMVATEHVKPFRNDDVRLFILHHELGHCCDDRTVAGQDLMQLAYEHTHGKKPEEVISFVEEHNRRTGLAGEYFADEFAARYLGCRKAFRALRTLLRASKVMVECLKLEYTEEMQQPVKDRMRNIFRKRKELRAARRARPLLTLEELAALSEKQRRQAA